MNIVSLTLRDCLSLSFQGRYIYLVIIIIIIIIIIIFIFHLIWSHFNSRGGNLEGGGRDTCPHIDTTVKPLLSGPPIKRTPSIKRTLGTVPKVSG